MSLADATCKALPGMLTYILRRILATIPVMAIVALIVFSLI